MYVRDYVHRAYPATKRQVHSCRCDRQSARDNW